MQDSFASPARYIAVRRSGYDPATETYVTEIMVVTGDGRKTCHPPERLGFEAALSLSKAYAREYRIEHLAWLMDGDNRPAPGHQAMLHVRQLGEADHGHGD